MFYILSYTITLTYESLNFKYLDLVIYKEDTGVFICLIIDNRLWEISRFTNLRTLAVWTRPCFVGLNQFWSWKGLHVLAERDNNHDTDFLTLMRTGTPFWRLVLKQFDDLLVKILIVAAIVSFLLALANGETGLSAFLEPSVRYHYVSQLLQFTSIIPLQLHLDMI